MLPNNRPTALKMAHSQEEKIKKICQLEKYNEEVRKYTERGVIVEITEEEKNTWRWPFNYIRHHGMEKESVSTPLRIVTNSSLKNGKWRLNECMSKCPNNINSISCCLDSKREGWLC